MKKGIWIPAVLFITLYVGFVALVGMTAHLMPARLATHFDANGEPNGWMSRGGHVQFILLVGSGISVFIIGLCYLLRFLPAGLLNIPNREHWLTPQRRQVTNRILFQHSLWFSCLFIVFMAALHVLVLQANQIAPPQLPVTAVLTVLGCFIVGILAWILTLLLRFRVTNPTTPTAGA